MNASGPDPSLSRTTFWGLFLALVLVRVPYFLTHHIQEDAYIAFRTDSTRRPRRLFVQR
jgi:hypothetical protein